MTADEPGLVAPRRLTYVRLSDLRPAIRNPKKHHLPGLIAAIARFGWTQPVLADERTGRLVAGHGRMAAAVDMKGAGDPLPGGLLIDNDGEWLIPVVRGWSSRTDAEAEAVLAADNKLPESGGWDDRELVAMLEDIQIADATLFEALTWTTDELDDLFRLYREDTDPDDPQPTVERSTDDADDSDDEDEDGDGEGGSDRISRDIECPSCGHTWQK